VNRKTRLWKTALITGGIVLGLVGSIWTGDMAVVGVALALVTLGLFL